jgi:hypothetical protein
MRRSPFTHPSLTLAHLAREVRMFKSGMVWVSGEVSSERIMVVLYCQIAPAHFAYAPTESTGDTDLLTLTG